MPPHDIERMIFYGIIDIVGFLARAETEKKLFFFGFCEKNNNTYFFKYCLIGKSTWPWLSVAWAFCPCFTHYPTQLLNSPPNFNLLTCLL